MNTTIEKPFGLTFHFIGFDRGLVISTGTPVDRKWTDKHDKCHLPLNNATLSIKYQHLVLSIKY